MKHLLIVACLIAVTTAQEPTVEPTPTGPNNRAAEQDRVHMANGIKTGEVSRDSALVWVRLTRHAQAKTDGAQFPKRKMKEVQLPAGKVVADMQGAVPGANGEVRLRYQVHGSQGQPVVTQWVRVDSPTDFSHTFALRDLTLPRFHGHGVK